MEILKLAQQCDVHIVAAINLCSYWPIRQWKAKICQPGNVLVVVATT